MKYTSTLLLLIVSLAKPALGDVITLRADNFCPFNCEPGTPLPGFAVEVAEKIFAKNGHTIEYKVLSWARTLADVKAGSYDGAIAAADADAKSTGILLGKENLGVINSCLYAKEGSAAKYTKAKDMKQFKKIGAVLDVDYGDTINEYMAKNKKSFDLAVGDDPTAKNILKLGAGRIDAALEDSNVMAYYIQTGKAKGIIKVGCDSVRTPAFIGFSPKKPKSKEYIVLLDAGIIQMRKSGELKTILDKYGVSDWK